MRDAEGEDRKQVANPEATELDLLSAARAGSHDAGRRLMSLHGSSMVRTAWSVLGRYGPNDAEDVVQEAFIAALTTRAIPTGDLGAWLRAITARKALDFVRGARRRGEQPLLGEDSPAIERGTGAVTDPPATLHVLAVRQALARLSSADRAVLVLVDLEGWSMSETARALGFTHVAVRLRAVRARRRLARELRPGRPWSAVSRRQTGGTG